MKKGLWSVALAGVLTLGLQAMPVLAEEGCPSCPLQKKMQEMKKAMPGGCENSCPTTKASSKKAEPVYAVMKIVNGEQVDFKVVECSTDTPKTSCCSVTGLKTTTVKTFPRTEKGKESAEAYAKELSEQKKS